STVNMAKFGATSSGETSVGSGGVTSTVVVEEMVAVIAPNQATIESMSMESVGEVIARIEEKSVAAGQAELELLERAKTAPVVNTTPATYVSSGVPTFGGASAAVANRPKIEIVGEACESCSA
ncbi:MAG TPA: hypothetical protein VIY48_05895, partial [Candidatus Paceibacterota bacterium]